MMNLHYPDGWSERTDEEKYAIITEKIAESAESAAGYAMLGEYYSGTNQNMAYLCYEQAAFYCERNGEDEELHQELEERLSELRSSEGVTVRPASFIILSMNTLDFTRNCLETIRGTCRKGSYEIVVVDNGSEDGSVEYLSEQEDVVLRCNDYNAGFPAGCNQGVRIASKKNDILLLNSDTELPPNAFFTLRLGLYADPRGAARTMRSGSS